MALKINSFENFNFVVSSTRVNQEWITSKYRTIIWFISYLDPYPRRPRRPGPSSSLFPSWDSRFLSQMFAHQTRSPWSKTRTSAMTIRTGTRDSKIQDGEDVDVPRSLALESILIPISPWPLNCWNANFGLAWISSLFHLYPRVPNRPFWWWNSHNMVQSVNNLLDHTVFILVIKSIVI